MTNKQQAEQNLTQIIERVLDEAKKQGATSAEADMGTGSGLSVTARLGEVEKIEHERDKGLGVTVFIGHKKGNASSTDVSDKAIIETVKAACDIARYASEDDCAGLADAKYMAKKIPELDLCHPWNITAEGASQLAIECENHALESDERIQNSDGCVVSSYSGKHLYGNSHGFVGGWDWSSHMIDCTMIAEDAQGMQRDGWYSKARDEADLESIQTIGQEAARRTLVKLGSRKLSTRDCPILFEAPVASSLFSPFLTAISGSALYRKASFLQDTLGKQIFPEYMHIHEQPHLHKAMGSAPFDNDGVATGNHDIIQDGILQMYIVSAYSGRKLGLNPTGNSGGVHNLTIEPGQSDLDKLLKEMGTGLFITDMIGFGVNQVNGDYSRGASGFWVENGELQYPVEEITVAGNLKDIYKQILQVGNDIDYRGNIHSGSVLIENMTIAGE